MMRLLLGATVARGEAMLGKIAPFLDQVMTGVGLPVAWQLRTVVVPSSVVRSGVDRVS